ncbi:MAG TPA: (2Fe-2S)-binding protein, partial [Steroidobacteraceae bacterium]|nr:(2Fe-2S)-binding protein [Steroidobacteraceae bacterium]
RFEASVYVCICHAVTDRQVREVVDRGVGSVAELQMHLPVGACCGRCVDTAEEIIASHRAQNEAATPPTARAA